MSIVRGILSHARTRPDAAALADTSRELTYRALGEEVLRTAGHLAALGVGPVDRVGICLKDTAEYVVAFLAATGLGAAALPIDWRARPTEKAHAAEAFAPRLVLVEPEERGLAGPSAVAVDADWKKAVAHAAAADLLPDAWQLPFVITSTSGTTGAPKYGLQTHLQYFFCINAGIELLPLPRHGRYLATLPLHFANGRKKCLTHLLRGDSVVLRSPLLSAREYVDMAARLDINVGHVLPAALRQLLQLAEDGRRLLPTLDLLVSAGAPLTADEKRALLRNVTPHFHEEYGTAIAGIISVLRPEDMIERAASVGQPHSMVELEVVDDGDAALSHGIVGKLRCRGPGVGSGISGGSGTEAASEGFRDGWYYPGELAALDERGFIYLKGRTAEVIVRAGAKIFPVEVEAALQEHPAVAEAAVIGRRAADGEEHVVAFVVARHPVEAGALIAHCRARLTAYKTPREIRFVAQMPKSPIGKINKRALAEAFDKPD